MDKLLRLANIIDQVNEWIGRLSSWFVLLMVGIGTWNVVGRYLGRFLGQNLTSNALIEMQWYLFDLVFFLGAAYALKHDEHVRVDLFYKGWNGKQRAIANLIGTFLFLIPFCLMVIYFSWGSIANSWAIGESSPDPGGLPRYPIKSMLVVSYILLIFQGLAEAIKNWAILTNRLTPQEEHHDAGF